MCPKLTHRIALLWWVDCFRPQTRRAWRTTFLCCLRWNDWFLFDQFWILRLIVWHSQQHPICVTKNWNWLDYVNGNQWNALYDILEFNIEMFSLPQKIHAKHRILIHFLQTSPISFIHMYINNVTNGNTILLFLSVSLHQSTFTINE